MVLIFFCLQHSESGTSFAVRIINMVCTMGLVAHWNGCLNFLIPMLNGFPSDCWIAINELQVLCCIEAMKLHRKQNHTCWQVLGRSILMIKATILGVINSLQITCSENQRKYYFFIMYTLACKILLRYIITMTTRYL